MYKRIDDRVKEKKRRRKNMRIRMTGGKDETKNKRNKKKIDGGR